jgi:hypothetical protein
MSRAARKRLTIWCNVEEQRVKDVQQHFGVMIVQVDLVGAERRPDGLAAGRRVE